MNPELTNKTQYHQGLGLFAKGLLSVSLVLLLNSGVVNASVVPLSIQTPSYPGDALMSNPNHGVALTTDLILINAYADINQIQAQLDAGINHAGGAYVALPAEAFYGPVPKPNQGVIILGTRLNFIVSDLGVPALNTPPSLGQAPGYANVFVTLAISLAHPEYGPVVVELVTYANYPDAISDAFGIPRTTPVHIAFKDFNLTVNHDLRSGMKTYAVLSKGANGFVFNYVLRAPNIVSAAAPETPFLDARNDPASAVILFQPTSRRTDFAFNGTNILLSNKTFPMPYGGVVKLNGILSGAVARDQDLKTCTLPFCP